MARGRRLRVHICGRPAGVLSRDSNGLLSFYYDGDYRGPQLSVRMPIGDSSYGNKVLVPYLAGLLPDADSQREAIASEHWVRADDYFSMLDIMGLDCPGGVQFTPAARDCEVGRERAYEPVSEYDIAERLRAIRGSGDEAWAAPGEHWSLGGNQGKFALALREGRWCSCRGSAPTTHIFKHGVSGMRLEALDEYVCMIAAKACGVPAAEVDYRRFADQPALVVRRYDRVETQDGTARIHQEDMCQALGFMPNRKYAADGGPSTRDVVRLLGGLNNLGANLSAFTKILFYNCLIWGIDAHAKNYSILIGHGGQFVLAPMYDVASALPYFPGHFKGKLAMSIGGKNQYGRVSAGAIRRYAGATEREVAEIFADAGLTADDCLGMMADLAKMVPKAIEEAFELSPHIKGAETLRARMVEPIADNCSMILSAL